MNFLQTKLTHLETRLQTLIEGSAARLIPFSGEPSNLPHQLVQTMRAGIQIDGDHQMVAPNLFTLIVDPAYAQTLRESQALLEELAEVIRQTGEEAGLQFSAPPLLRIHADPGMPPGEARIQAQVSGRKLDDTSTMALENGSASNPIPQNAFLIVGGSEVLPLNAPVMNIGRRPDNEIMIDDPHVSRLHAQLRAMKGRYLIFDLDSTGGTFVNGQRVQQSVLYPGDVISLGGVDLVFGQDVSPASDRESTSPLDALSPES
jgi:hypothetical protein